MIEKITIDNLTELSVSIKKQKIIMVDDVEYTLGLPSRKSYINSTKDREELKNEIQQQYLSAIFSVWGDSAIINEEISQ